MMPTVGIQLPVLALVWLLIRRFQANGYFNLLIASAWTMTTNVITAPPFYYLYVVTGRMLLGAWKELRGYAFFHHRLAEHQPVMGGAIEGWSHNLTELFSTFGLPLAIGWVPWTIVASWLGYRL